MYSSTGVGGAAGDAAVVVLVAGHPYVTLLTPGGAPGVLDHPELFVRLVAETNNQDSVVECGVHAVRLVVDACKQQHNLQPLENPCEKKFGMLEKGV